VFVTGGQTQTLLGVTISTHWNFLSENAVLIAFKLMNSNLLSQMVDVGVDSDIYFDGNDGASVESLSNDMGFVMYSSINSFTIIGRSYPLVRDLTTYWFGSQGSRSSYYWTQISSTSISGVDSGMTFSWQQILIPSNGSVTVSVIMRSGNFDPMSPILNMTNTIIPSQIPLTGSFSIHCSVSDSHSSVLVNLIMVINDDHSNI
jgi:hypothetical protein